MPEGNSEQVMFYSDEELEIIKATFADNTPLLKVLRKHFLQIELSEWDQNILGVLTKKPEVVKLLRKTFLPTLDLDVPLGQLVDLWVTVDVNNKPAEEVPYFLQARSLVIQYLDEQLQRLEEPDSDQSGLRFNGLLNKDYSNFMARNTITMHVEGQLIKLKQLAGQKTETVEEAKKRLERDSSK